MGNAVQSLFPEASLIEIKKARSYLEQYRKAKKMQETFPDRLTETQRGIIRDIDRSFGLIFDDDVRSIIEHRYIKGHSHKATIGYFIQKGWGERTIDRKILEGITIIANTLLFCGQLAESQK